MKGEIVIKQAKINGTGAVIYVPRKWLGYMVKAKCMDKVEGVK